MAQINGTRFDDVLVGTNDMDTIFAGLGDDLAQGESGDDSIYGEGGADRLYGGAGDDRLFGNDFSSLDSDIDLLDGGDGNDRLYGASNDTFIGGSGAGDWAYFGSGYEAGSLFFDNTNVNAANAIVVGGSGQGTVSGCEFVSVSGGLADDVIKAAGILSGNGGDDVVTALEGAAAQNDITRLWGSDVDGGIGDDHLYGASGSDTLAGDEGNDRVYGLGGDDLIEIDSGVDLYDGGSGSDWLMGFDIGLEAGFTINLGLTGSQQSVGLGMKTLVSIENVFGSEHGDTVTGSDGVNIFEDVFTFDGAYDRYFAMGGDDILVMGAILALQPGQVRIVDVDAGAGDDRVSLYLNLGQVNLTLGSGADLIELMGYDYRTEVDTTSITGQLDIADFQTGEGGDRLDFSRWIQEGVFVGYNAVSSADPFASGHLRLVQTGADAVLEFDQNGGGDQFSSLITFRNSAVGALAGSFGFGGAPVGDVPTAGADTLTGTANADIIDGLAGNDVISGLAGADRLFGGSGTDTLNGGDGNDVLVGNADIFAQEVDILNGGAGDDILYAEFTDSLAGGAGRDSLIAVNSYSFMLDMAATSIEYAVMDFGNDVITAAGQTSRVDVFASGGADSVTGSSFDDLLFGGSGNDTVVGGAGNDSLVGEAGVDSLNGGDGDDRIYLDAQDSFVFGGAGYDAAYITPGTGGGATVNLGASSLEFVQDLAGGNDILLGSTSAAGFSAYAGGGADTVDGSAFADVIWGEAGDDILAGNAGNDVIVGGAGSDRIDGGAGNDALYGGAGDGASDTFAFTSAGAAHADAVYDFVAGSDRIDLSGFGGNSFANVSITNAGGSSVVFLNGQQVCTVVGVTGLTAGDFIFTPGGAPAEPDDGFLLKGEDRANIQPVAPDDGFDAPLVQPGDPGGSGPWRPGVAEMDLGLMDFAVRPGERGFHALVSDHDWIV